VKAWIACQSFCHQACRHVACFLALVAWLKKKGSSGLDPVQMVQHDLDQLPSQTAAVAQASEHQHAQLFWTYVLAI